MQSNRVMVIIAVVSGLVAMAAAFGYLSNASGALAKEPAEAAIAIVVAKADLPADHLIDPAVDVEEQRVPSKTFGFLARAAVKSTEKAALRGRRLNTPIAAGSPIMYSHLVGVTDLEIVPGSRAFTIEIDETGIIGGILVPGDRVDIVVSWRLPEAKSSSTAPVGREQTLSEAVGQAVAGAMETRDWAARAALSNVKVLAVGDKLIRSREQFTFGDPNAKTARRTSAGTITLEVTTEEALELIRAMGGGSNRLYVLLRGKQSGENQGAGSGSVLE